MVKLSFPLFYLLGPLSFELSRTYYSGTDSSLIFALTLLYSSPSSRISSSLKNYFVESVSSRGGRRPCISLMSCSMRIWEAPSVTMSSPPRDPRRLAPSSGVFVLKGSPKSDARASWNRLCRAFSSIVSFLRSFSPDPSRLIGRLPWADCVAPLLYFDLSPLVREASYSCPLTKVRLFDTVGGFKAVLLPSTVSSSSLQCRSGFSS